MTYKIKDVSDLIHPIFYKPKSIDCNLHFIEGYARIYYNELKFTNKGLPLLNSELQEIREIVVKRFSSGVWVQLGIPFNTLFSYLDSNLFREGDDYDPFKGL